MSDEENKIKQTFSLAEKLFSEKKYRESIKNYEKILEKFPNMIGALNNIALNYEMLGDLDQAVLFYKKCYELKPNETLILNNLANTLYRKNNYDEAIKVYEESLEITNHQDEIINQYSHCIFLTRSKKDNDVFFKKVIKKYPNNKFLYTLYGKNLLFLGQHSDGLNLLKKGTGFIEFEETTVRYI